MCHPACCAVQLLGRGEVQAPTGENMGEFFAPDDVKSRHRLCLVFPLPSWLRQCLSLWSSGDLGRIAETDRGRERRRDQAALRPVHALRRDGPAGLATADTATPFGTSVHSGALRCH